MLRKFLYIIPCVFSFLTSFSQNFEFTATSDKSSYGMNENMVVTFRFESKGTDFKPPVFPDFKVLSGPNQSTSMSIQNGQTNYTLSFTYYLKSIKAGVFTIPPASITFEGKIYKSEPLKIEVKNYFVKEVPVGIDIEEDDVFLRIETDKQKIGRDESIIADYKVYSVFDRATLENVTISLPDYFLSETIDLTTALQEEEKKILNNKSYHVYTVKRSFLHPLKPGKFEINSFEASVNIRIKKEKEKDDSKFFDDFFTDYNDTTLVLRSNALWVTVDNSQNLMSDQFTRNELIALLNKEKPMPADLQKTRKIVFAVDISGSMLYEDFSTGRLNAVQQALLDFISQSKNDSIGLTEFADFGSTRCAPTFEYQDVKAAVELLTIDTSYERGTGIGMGISNAAKLLQSGEGEKVLVLLTDGVNNAGNITPITASEAAGNMNIRIYVIGIGGDGKAPYPYRQNGKVEMREAEIFLDELLMQNIAAKTGGKYFRARNENELNRAMESIRKLLAHY